jgi:hypothetical protein
MKTIKLTIVLALMFALSIGATSAQQVASITLTPDKNGEQPSEVVSEVEMDFNSIKPVEKALNSFARMPLRWKITQEDFNTFSNGEELKYINVVTNYKDGQRNSTYNAKGDLVSFKETVNNAPLPEIAESTIKTQYPNWNEVGDKEFIDSNAKKSDYYKVQVTNGNAKKNLYFDLSGNELNKHLKQINKEGFAAN